MRGCGRGQETDPRHAQKCRQKHGRERGEREGGHGIVGHLTRTVFENYHIVSTDDLVKAVQKVSAATEKAKKPQEKEKEGIIPNVPFRSAEHGGDFIMHAEGNEIFPPEVVHFRKPTEKEWRAYLDYAAGEFGIDFIRELAEKLEGDKKSKVHARLAREKVESLEKGKVK